MARKAQTPASATVPHGGDVSVMRSAQIAFYFSALDAYQNAEQGFEQAKDACAAAAFDLLKPATSHEVFLEVREAVKAAYMAKRNPQTEEEKTKATNAANMLWSRCVARATSKGYKQPEIPQTDEAKVRQAKRDAAKEAKGKTAYDAAIASGATVEVAERLRALAVDGRKGKAALNAAQQPGNAPADLSDDSIAIARQIDQQDNEGQLFDALEYVLENASHVALFISWATAQQKSTRSVRAA